jgi:uncharacterized RDD family membrane protein YckC
MRQDLKLDTLQSVEVAEGVDILLRPAGPIPRGFAYLIDILVRWIIFGILALLYALGLSLFGARGAEFGLGIMLLLLFMIEWAYYVVCEAVWGRSYGKKLFGLKVVRTSGVPIGWGAAILRNLLRTVDGMPWLGMGMTGLFPTGLVGLGAILLTRRFQRIGDLLADTVVIYAERAAEVQAPEYNAVVRNQLQPEPPGITLTREEQRAVVLYLERAGLWSDARKEELANHLEPLTGQQGRAGVLRLMGMGIWLRDS